MRGKYILQINLFDKVKRCEWALLVVYGAAHDENKPEFLADCLPFVIRLILHIWWVVILTSLDTVGKRIKRLLYPISRMSLMLSFIY